MLNIRNLSAVARNGRTLLKGIHFNLKKGEILGLTGESGCGKTTLIKCIMGLIRKERVLVKGEVLLDESNVETLSAREHRMLCGTSIGFIPQNPMTAFDPSWKIGGQMSETFRVRLHMKSKEAEEYAKEILQQMNLKNSDRILDSYPQQLSGGMLQRIAVGLVFGLSPSYILADEPTSALDESNRELIMELLLSRQQKSGILLITHDVYLLKNTAEHFMVMDAGEIVEAGATEELFARPANIHTAEFVKDTRAEYEDEWVWTR